MKNLILSLIVVSVAAALFSFIADPAKDLIGTWHFTAKDAPEGYNRGDIEFTEKEGALHGKMITENGTFPMENLKVANDSIAYQLSVQSLVMQALLVKVKDSLSGKIITPEGDLRIIGRRQEAK
jgi:hypothetical protein